jgi:hypothetical protein
MLRQQCKVQGLACKASLSLGQLRLVPKIGQGVNYVKGLFVTKDYKLLTKITKE